jgi:hypothetical protein
MFDPLDIMSSYARYVGIYCRNMSDSQLLELYRVAEDDTQYLCAVVELEFREIKYE